MKVTVSCLGKFHAFALAEQLQKHNALDKLYTSYAYQKNENFRKLAKRIDHELIFPNLIRTNIPIAVGIKLKPHDFFWNALYDRWVAAQIIKSKSTIFIGWSGMSLRSILSAKKNGMTTIVERGSSHILFQNEILKEEYKKFGQDFSIHPKIIETELKEYEEADYISIPSKYVKQTFIDKGISANKLVLNNYGSSFIPSKNLREKNSIKKFVILYVGAITIQKGIIYLFEALLSLKIDKKYFEVHFIGTIADEMKKTVENFKQNNWIFYGQIEQAQLIHFISQADVAIQPSLQEGLSMVIPQILSCGVPVIATTNTGGEDLIINNVNGYIIPIRNSNSIKDKIEFLFFDSETLNRLKSNTTQLNDLSWNAYGDRYFNFLESINK